MSYEHSMNISHIRIYAYYGYVTGDPFVSENYNTDCGLSICCILTFDPAKHAIPKWCTGKKWHIPMASNRKKSRKRIWLTKWDKLKAHDTIIDWCTGREWPLNCMTVISAWWRSNIPFQRLSGRLSGLLNYYITRWRQGVSKLESDELGTRVVEKARTQQSGPLGLRLSSPGERERHNADGHKSGGQYIAVFVQSPTPSHTQTLQ